MFFIRWLWRVVWSDVTLCSLLVERCVLRTCCLHFQGWTRKKLTVVTVSLCLIFEPQYGDKSFFRNIHNLIFYFIPCHIREDNLVANGIPCRIYIFICNFFTVVIIKIIIVWMWRCIVSSMVRKNSEESLWIWRQQFFFSKSRLAIDNIVK